MEKAPGVKGFPSNRILSILLDVSPPTIGRAFAQLASTGLEVPGQRVSAKGHLSATTTIGQAPD